MTKKDCTTCANRALPPAFGPCAACDLTNDYQGWIRLHSKRDYSDMRPAGHVPPRPIPAPAPAHVLEDAFREAEVQHAQASALDTQVGGDHYKKMGDFQPWPVLKHWLTEDEFRGYMKGTAIAYLARERDKGGMQDIEKAGHTLAGLVEMAGKK